MFFIFIYEILIKRLKLFQNNISDNNLLNNKNYNDKIETIIYNNENLTEREKKIKKFFDDKYIIEIV